MARMRATAESNAPFTYLWLMALPALDPARRVWAPELGGGHGPVTRLKILLVEDDHAIAEMYRMQLARDGYLVEHAVDAASALERLREDPPHLVLLDILLPGPDGFSVLEGMQDQPQIPVVILSNYGDSAMVERGKQLGARDYVVKSRVTPRDVSRAIPGWISHQGR